MNYKKSIDVAIKPIEGVIACYKALKQVVTDVIYFEPNYEYWVPPKLLKLPPTFIVDEADKKRLEDKVMLLKEHYQNIRK